MKPCNRCGKPIRWGRSEHALNDKGQRKWIPLDYDPDPLGIVELKDKTAVFAGPSQDPAAIRYMPHEATCSAVQKGRARDRSQSSG